MRLDEWTVLFFSLVLIASMGFGIWESTKEFWLILGEALMVGTKLGVFLRWVGWFAKEVGGILGEAWVETWRAIGEGGRILGERFGRLFAKSWYLGVLVRTIFKHRKESHRFTWWIYYVAVKRSLRHARMAKYSWMKSIDVETCLAFYDRYAGVQKRAMERGYVRLASEDIHDKYVLKELAKTKKG